MPVKSTPWQSQPFDAQIEGASQITGNDHAIPAHILYR
jgi:hypothetical protein